MDLMRLSCFFAAAVAAVIVSGTASAQTWSEFVNRDDFFSVNFPGEPARQEFTYKTAKGTSLPAHLYQAQDARGHYTITVVDYNGAKDELKTAMDEAAKNLRTKGTVRYDAVNMLDNHRSWRMTVETPEKRVILAEILAAMNNRLYISASDTALNIPPPAQFQVSLQILDDQGLRIRYRQVTGATPDEVVPVTPQARDIEVARMVGQVAGNWKDPAGSCESAFLKAGQRVKTGRGEEAMTGTVVNKGVTIPGQLIIAGPREGQFIDAKTDKAIALFDPDGSKMSFSPIGAPATGWPDVTLELCPGSRG
jgi:hypothetical protein